MRKTVAAMTMTTLFASLVSLSGLAQAAPETFAIDPTHTAPRFEYTHQGLSSQIHRFDRTSGQIVLDRAAKTASVDVRIDAKSINTGFAAFNEHMQGEDFFNTAQFPDITFKSTAVRFEGDKPVAVEGHLTIKGVTRPVILMITSFLIKPHPMAKKDALGANAVAKIKRSEFNLGKYPAAVPDEVSLSLAVEALAQ